MSLIIIMVMASKPQKLSTKFQLKERARSFQTTSVPSSCMCRSSSLLLFTIVSTVSAGCKLQQLPAPQCLQLTLVRSATCHFHPLKPVYMKAIKFECVYHKAYNCPKCLVSQLPFNQISDEDVVDFYCDRNDLNSATLPKAHDLPKLAVFTEHQTNKPLINNIDLDPDDNYYEVKPIDYGYNTPTQLYSKRESNFHLCSDMHVNCRSIASKMNELKLLLSQTPVGVLAVTETWLEENVADTIHIQGYHFVHQEMGILGGVGFFY